MAQDDCALMVGKSSQHSITRPPCSAICIKTYNSHLFVSDLPTSHAVFPSRRNMLLVRFSLRKPGVSSRTAAGESHSRGSGSDE